jgi:hypothetical protein
MLPTWLFTEVPYARAFGHNLATALKWAGPLGALGILIDLVLGAPLLEATIGALGVIVLLLPAGALTFTLLAPLQRRGSTGHYATWLLTCIGASLPGYLLSLQNQPRPSPKEWLTYALGVMAAALLCGAVTKVTLRGRSGSRAE